VKHIYSNTRTIIALRRPGRPKLRCSHLDGRAPSPRADGISLAARETHRGGAMTDPLDRNRSEEDVEQTNEEDLVDTADDDEDFEEIDESEDEADAEDLE
jgi:hypothetical protein